MANDKGPFERLFPAVSSAEERRIPRRRRVFVNRNLRLKSIGAIGFDLDHTLAHYDPVPVEDLAFRVTQQRLVRKRGYPAAIASIRYDPEFVIRGLVIDHLRGNILKMDYHNFVTRAFHGRKELSREKLGLYRRRRVSLSSKNYSSVDTLFHLPEVYLYLSIIDLLEERGEKPDFRKIQRDVRETIDQAHADGSIKSVIRDNPSRFIQSDVKLLQTLDRLRLWGKKLFLLTNSEYYYTDVLLKHLLRGGKGEEGEEWQRFFDAVITDAEKPSFFDGKKPVSPRPIRKSRRPSAGRGGNVRFLEGRLGFQGDEVLYFGDHTYGDILRAKKSAGWRTAMVVLELENELKVTQQIAPKLRIYSGLTEERDRIEMEISSLERERARLELLNGDEKVGRTRARREKKISFFAEEIRGRARKVEELNRQSEATWRECDRSYNRVWGPIFREGKETSRFGHQVKDFACLYTSRVSNFLNYDGDHYFRSPMDRMPHEM
ncbi:MAG: HAD-IG family 5'-nucleotidase [Candidatus Eisenbacteria bacterium]